jgi:hypothetical protein
MAPSASQPAAGSYWLQNSPGDALTTRHLTGYTGSGTADGAGLAFGAGTAAEIKSSAAGWSLKGDGSAKFGGTSGDAILIGDDAKLVDVNLGDTLGVQGQQTPANGVIVFGSGKDTNLYRGGTNILKTDDSLHAAGHGLVEYQSTPSTTTCTTIGVFYAVGSTPAEVAFTPAYVGQRWLVFLDAASAYWSATNAGLVNLRVTDSSNATIEDQLVYGRHEEAASTYVSYMGSGIWVADSTAARKAKLYISGSAAGVVVTWGWMRIQVYPLP